MMIAPFPNRILRRIVHRLVLCLILSWMGCAHAVDCIAHRGESTHHPDNTLESIAAAWKAGADVVEVDVRMLADGSLVLFHDPEVGGRALKDLDRAGLGLLTPDFKVPTLEQGLLAAESGKALLLDLKENSEPYLDKVLQQVKASKVPGVRVMFQNTDFKALEYLRKKSSADTVLLHVTDLKAADTQQEAELLVAKLVEMNLQGVTAKGRQHVDAAFVSAFRKRGLKYLVWTINEPDRMQHYAGLGVDGVITDDPAAFRTVCPVKKAGAVLPAP